MPIHANRLLYESTASMLFKYIYIYIAGSLFAGAWNILIWIHCYVIIYIYTIRNHQMSASTFRYTQTQTQTQTHTRTHARTHARTHTHTHTNSLSRPLPPEISKVTQLFTARFWFGLFMVKNDEIRSIVQYIS